MNNCTTVMQNDAGSSKSATSVSRESFDTYSSALQAAALNSTKLAAALPSDIAFHRSVDKDFAQSLEVCSERTLKLANKLIDLSNINSRSKGKAKLQNEEDILDNFQALVGDVLDQLFEQADTNLDEHAGRSKHPVIPVKSTPNAPAAVTSSNRQGRLDPSLTHASYLAKPQLKFKRKVDNTNGTVWAPNLKHKYNAQVPQGYVYRDVSSNSEAAPTRVPHPYRYEIEHIPYPSRMFEHQDPIPPKSFSKTPFTWVDTRHLFDAMLDRLRIAQELAVDLEHHSYRSYSGFLCLMQISTREEDFIVDTLALREELEELNEVFTDPRIVKVFHGAESDIVWLQQDFNIYVVNLFDTYHASKILDFPRHGLASLLEMYCDFIPDKRYQLADWRIRPLPVEMLDYARSDTHFLLFIYDSLRNALIDRAGGKPDLIKDVLTRSQETALRTYERELYDIESGGGSIGWDTLALKWGRVFNGTTRAVFRAVHAWRDAVARTEDESTRYVLPNHYLFQLSERPPADMTALMNTFRPVPQLVRIKAASLLETIRTAVRESMTQAGDEKRAEANVSAKSLENGNTIFTSEATREATDVKTGSATKSESENAAMKGHDLWSAPKSDDNTMMAKASALLGSLSGLLKGKATSRAVSTRTSTLFSVDITKTSTVTSVPRYEEVVSRIHSSLVVAPTLPKIPLSNANTNAGQKLNEDVITPNSEAVVTKETKTETNEQIEIPFVPAGQRLALNDAKMEVTETDSIVVVGRAKKRKRVQSMKQQPAEQGKTDIGELGNAEPAVAVNRQKRAKGSRSSSANAVIAEASGGGSVAPESKAEFDYSTAPNFLDNPQSTQIASPTVKAKKKKGRSAAESSKPDFPKAPRGNAQPKNANRSYTFTK